MMLAREGAASYGPKSAMVLSEPVDKHGSEVADKSVMTLSIPVAISIRRLQGFAPQAAFSAQGEDNGEDAREARVQSCCVGARCRGDRHRSGRDLCGGSPGPRRGLHTQVQQLHL